MELSSIWPLLKAGERTVERTDKAGPVGNWRDGYDGYDGYEEFARFAQFEEAERCERS